MPTNLIKPLANRPGGLASEAGGPRAGKARHIYLEAAGVRLQLALYDTPTALRIAQAIPLYGVAEPWGQCLHFKLPIGSGRERGARLNARLGEVYYWTGEDRVLIPFGPTPISRASEIRLPTPCNPWAEIVGEVAPLQGVAPSAKVTLKA